MADIVVTLTGREITDALARYVAQEYGLFGYIEVHLRARPDATNPNGCTFTAEVRNTEAHVTNHNKPSPDVAR